MIRWRWHQTKSTHLLPLVSNRYDNWFVRESKEEIFRIKDKTEPFEWRHVGRKEGWSYKGDRRGVGGIKKFNSSPGKGMVMFWRAFEMAVGAQDRWLLCSKQSTTWSTTWWCVTFSRCHPFPQSRTPFPQSRTPATGHPVPDTAWGLECKVCTGPLCRISLCFLLIYFCITFDKLIHKLSKEWERDKCTQNQKPHIHKCKHR